VDGLELPSVSAIMRPLADEHYKNIPVTTLQNAADRGKAIHKMVERFETEGLEVDATYAPHLRWYQLAKRMERFTPIEVETMLTNGQFCGTLDQIAKINDEFVIVDLKATAQINVDLLRVQLAAYYELAKHNGYDIKGCFVLHLKPDGNGYRFKRIHPDFELWAKAKENYFAGR
jgi:hypothetical protein